MTIEIKWAHVFPKLITTRKSINVYLLTIIVFFKINASFMLEYRHINNNKNVFYYCCLNTVKTSMQGYSKELIRKRTITHKLSS